MTNLKERLDAKLIEHRTETAIPAPSPMPSPENDAALKAALARVEKGELNAAYRTRNGALAITHKSDPANSPAAPEAHAGVA